MQDREPAVGTDPSVPCEALPPEEDVQPLFPGGHTSHRSHNCNPSGAGAPREYLQEAETRTAAGTGTCSIGQKLQNCCLELKATTRCGGHGACKALPDHRISLQRCKEKKETHQEKNNIVLKFFM